ncbi:MAG: carboxypeptidase regulatory-like domain-containing protein, partial [Smithellaceae bacterium]|nr:carboxypeptidase regulatory-like domain-containing protein [Smithellaceae bacterium]
MKPSAGARHIKYLQPLLLLGLLAITLLACSRPTYSISGQITSGGAALPGVTVTLSGDTLQTTTTDGNGNYAFSDVSIGIYTLTPTLTGYSFSPPSRAVYLDGVDAIGFNFSGAGAGKVASTLHTVYLKNDNTIWTWGNNSSGQLGNGTTTQSSTPAQVSGLTDMTAIAAGFDHT